MLAFVHPHHLAKLGGELHAAFPDMALLVEDAYGERRVKDEGNPGSYTTLPAEDPDTLHVTLALPEPVPPPPLRVPQPPKAPLAPAPPGTPADYGGLALFLQAVKRYQQQTQAYSAATEAYSQRLADYQADLAAQPQREAEQNQKLQAYQTAKDAYDARVQTFLTTDKDAIAQIVSAHDPTPPVVVDPFSALDDTTLGGIVTDAQAVASLANAKAVLVALAQNQLRLARYLRRQAGHV
jgi:hypothetical protein